MSYTPIGNQEQFVKDFISYMSDCAFTAKDARSHFNVVTTLEACYRPEQGFWQQLDVAAVEQAVGAYNRQLGDAKLRTSVEFRKEIALYLYMNQRDERNAEMLGQLPRGIRPDGAESATKWICTELKNQGQLDELEYAERDGDGCGEAALVHLAIIDAASQGRTALRLGAQLAEHFRKIQLATREGHEAPAFRNC